MIKVLQNKSQIVKAREELVRRGVSCIDPMSLSLMRRIGLYKGVSVGDNIKSWDVLETLNFVLDNVSKDKPVLDIGSYASEVPVALHRMGYTDVTGVDINVNLHKMPFNNFIRYVQANFMETGFNDASFYAITSISVIEHGFDGVRLLKEMARILKPGGYFLASFDYCPEKIDTSGITFFGMEWRIFSREDVVEFIDLAADYGFNSVGESHYDGQEMPIDCGGKEYTFGWLALKKSA